VNVEIVVSGALGELAQWALPEVLAERRQVLLALSADALPTPECLTARGVEVLTMRERPNPLTWTYAHQSPSGETRTGHHAETEHGPPPSRQRETTARTTTPS